MHLAGVMRYKLKTKLARYIQGQTVDGQYQSCAPRPSPAYHGPPWCVTDRLSERAIREIIAAFKAETLK